MNIAYFRKSTHSLEKTIALVKKEITNSKWVIVGETRLGHYKGTMFLISYPEVVDTVIAENHQLLGLLPVSLIIFERGKEVLVGSGHTSLLKAIAKSPKITALGDSIEKELQDIIHSAAGVEKLQAKKVKLYSTKTCPYCKMEKEWLEEKKIQHEVIYVDENQQEAEYMVRKTGQMGVPVTEVQYDGADPEFVIGFDKDRLTSLLNS